MAIRQPVTITQVAEAAGVSIATVSRVLNRRGQVDEHTRKRVLHQAEHLGYDATLLAKRRETAQTMPEAESYNVELLLCPLAEQKNLLQLDFIAEVMRGIQGVFNRQGNIRMNFSTWEVDEVLHHEENELIFNRLRAADGVLVMGTPGTALVERLAATGVTLVLVSNDWQDRPLNSVSFDDFSGGVTAACHLIERGFTRIGYLCGSPRNRAFEMRRKGAMVTAIDQLGYENFDHRTALSSDNAEIRRLVAEWLDSGKCPKAIITSHGNAARVFLEELEKRGLSSPADYSLVTFDRPDGAVTSLVTDPRELGIKAAQRLRQLMETKGNGENPYKIVLPLALVEGNSVANNRRIR